MRLVLIVMAVIVSGCGPVTKGEGCKLTCDALCAAQAGCLKAADCPVDPDRAACVARHPRPEECPADTAHDACVARAESFAAPTCSPKCQTECCVGFDCAEQIVPARATACAEGWSTAKCGLAGASQPEACK